MKSSWLSLVTRRSTSRLVLLSTVALLLIGWPSLDDITDIGKSTKSIGKSIVTSTGIVSSSQLDALLEAGGKLDEATDSLTDEQEYFLGRTVAALILREFPLYRGNPNLTKYLNQVGQALAARSTRPEIFGGYHFAILDTDQINALSAPGGFIFVSRGFLELMPSEEALAGVLSHELAHVILRHGVNAISQGKLSEAALILGREAVSSYGPSELNQVTELFGDSVNQVFDTLMKSGYSRSQEYEADAFAAKLMAKAGYDSKGLVAMLDGIAKADAKSRGGWLDTHPSPGDRKGEVSLPKQGNLTEAVAIRSERFTRHNQ